MDLVVCFRSFRIQDGFTIHSQAHTRKGGLTRSMWSSLGQGRQSQKGRKSEAGEDQAFKIKQVKQVTLLKHLASLHLCDKIQFNV